MRQGPVAQDGDRQSEPLSVAMVFGISGVDPLEWDACAAGKGPFLRHAYLSAVEDGGLAVPENGWRPAHMIARDVCGRMVGAVPLYFRDRSTDEFWPDQAWIDGFQASGGCYFPKLVMEVPYTPVTGARILLREGAPSGVAEALTGAMRSLAHKHGLSSIHVSYPDEEDRARFEAAGWLTRHAVDYEWRNEGYGDFTDFTAALSSRRRSVMLWERRKIIESGVRFRDVLGSHVGEADVAVFLDLLADLHARKGRRQALTMDFVLRLCANFGDAVTLTFAECGGVAIGTLLTVEGDDCLYVRTWGAREETRFVHFETCYYRTIERAIACGMGRVNGGRGGPHKLERGFLPKFAYACHWFLHTNMRRAVAEGLELHNAKVLAAFTQEQARSPFRRQAG
ncbi:GNAT family N-acetyltransferase [Azospirillum sp. B2RO_4]|uniref:GNAT family N-acetyltransferase n=1 Tax=Azospirillum sp. B2RO_4 TaxID=3027796 RepID=UPI003DAA014B